MPNLNSKDDIFEFRVVAGTLKGMRITAPKLGITRPPLTRIRKSIFDFLNPRLPGAAYLDLFSGTGSYLFEAVSRGASMAVGVELNDLLAAAINSQANGAAVADQLNCLNDDVFEAIPKLSKQGRRFDVIMIAPPQYEGIIEKTLACLQNYPLSTDRGIILCQHASSEREIGFLDFLIEQKRKYGNTTFTVLAPPN